jgi:hypothetical protein
MRFYVSLTLAAAVSLGASVAAAQQMYIYPEHAQSADQQARDKAECSQWATNETHFDPSAPPPQATAQAHSGGAVRGAARGALLGVAVGARAGDAGKGAAIGATAGGLGGAMRRRDSQMQAEQQNQQSAAQYDARRNDHKRAMTACLEARGYKVS